MRKKENKGWRTFKTAFKWAFIIIAIILLLDYIYDLLHHIQFLAEKVNIQNHNIDLLQGNIHDLQQANNHLIDQLQVEHSKVQHLQEQLSVKINGDPVDMTVDDIEKEIKPQLKFETSNPYNYIPVIVGAMSTLKSLLFRLSF
jgi:predicted Holliday junction resolvase-like endonuclease